MSESPEHAFLKTSFLKVLSDFSNTKLYGFTETQRRKFDFSCLLERDWSRPLVGQVVWKHTKGIDKDIRCLVADPAAEIGAYVARDNMKSRGLFEEITHDFQQLYQSERPFRLKVFWIPNDFDAARKKQRELVYQNLLSSIVDDILFNVVFGRLTSDDVRYFLNISGIPGLNLALLHEIATHGFFNYADMTRRLRVSAGPIRERLETLCGCGLLWKLRAEAMYYVSPKGRLFLDLIARVIRELRNNNLSPELTYILVKLNCEPAEYTQVLKNDKIFPTNAYVALLKTVDWAIKNWGIDFSLPMEFTPDVRELKRLDVLHR